MTTIHCSEEGSNLVEKPLENEVRTASENESKKNRIRVDGAKTNRETYLCSFIEIDHATKVQTFDKKQTLHYFEVAEIAGILRILSLHYSICVLFEQYSVQL